MSVSEVALRGFFLFLRVPSEESLHVTLDASSLHPQTFLSLIHELQDRLRDMDEEYAENPKAMRGRSVKARHFRAFHIDERRRILRFSPVPSRYLNVFKSVRRSLYVALHRHAIVIQSEQGRNVYLLPEEDGATFLGRVEELNRLLERVEEEIASFTQTPRFDDLSLLLERHGLRELPKRFNIGRIQAHPVPVRMAVDEWIERSPQVAEALRKAREEFIAQAIQDLKRKLEPLIASLLSQKRLKSVAKDLQALENLAASVGLEAISKTVIAPLRLLAEMPPAEIAKIPEGLQPRVESLIKQMGIKVTPA
jgi:predicted house-cleaning noncanonical NTP pyrophosphatase (MazG superfamily)